MRDAMNTVRIRLLGDEGRTETLMNMLHGMAGVECIEALPVADGQCACSALESVDGAPEPTPAVCNLEVEVVDAGAASRIRTFAAGAAILLDASAEFVERF
jgi:hypothetical protein